MTNLKQWQQISDSSTNSKISSKVYKEFTEFYLSHRGGMTFAEDAAFRQLGYKLQIRKKSFDSELRSSQNMIDSLVK
tara:strand:- start:1415 stop:1645 length:231 start_codon:yes stop_codon:yes gene_type:complete